MTWALLVLVCGLSVIWGWLARGWFDRRMRPGVEPSSEVTRIGQRWRESIDTLKDREPLS